MELSYDFVKSIYISTDDNYVEDFYKPAIKNSVLYKRMTGYFSSKIIEELYDEIKFSSENNNFKMLIICSPQLSEQDVIDIQKGYEYKRIVEENVSKIFTESAPNSEKISDFSKLIVEGVIDFRFANMKNGKGIFHAKEGIFYSEDGEKLGFNGSNNETLAAIEDNFETTFTFKSKNSGHDKALIERMEILFTRIWNNENKKVLTCGISEMLFDTIKNVANSGNNISINSPRKIAEEYNLFDYQEQAIVNWRNNNYKGMFEMATGTGKTITALASLEKLIAEVKGLVTFIVVPQLDLLSQWSKEVEELGYRTIQCSSVHPNWDMKLKRVLSNKKILQNNIVILTTVNTLISEKMELIITNFLKSEALLIADEVHSFGAVKTREFFDILKEKFRYLLGVSATPFRRIEEETEEILSLFEGIVFTYSLQDAIKDGFLNSYNYYPILTFFDDSELHNYRLNINKSLSNSKYIPIQDIENITSSIINASAGKVEKLLELVKETGSRNPKIIYAAPGNVNDSKFKINEKHIEYVTRRVSELDCNVRKVNGLVEARERDEILQQFREDKLDTLVAVKVLDQGVNIKSVSHAFILASTDSKTEFIQRRGRLLRKNAGKPKSKIYDIIMLPHNIYDSVDNPEFEDAYVVSRELKRIKEYNSAADNILENESLVENIYNFYAEVLNEYDERQKSN